MERLRALGGRGGGGHRRAHLSMSSGNWRATIEYPPCCAHAAVAVLLRYKRSCAAKKRICGVREDASECEASACLVSRTGRRTPSLEARGLINDVMKVDNMCTQGDKRSKTQMRTVD
jgi:hypothetical protein